MAVYILNPLEDPRWAEFLHGHPRASVFHTSQWLDALQRTYGYLPLVFSTSEQSADLGNGLVFCRIDSRITGSRLVSLPFSDHCEPLMDEGQAVNEVSDYLMCEAGKNKWKYIELRPLTSSWGSLAGFRPGEQFYFHSLDLRSPHLFQNLHKNSTQRKIHRAEREGLHYEEGRSNTLLQNFYHLLKMTRQRHGLPPQPLDWFRNLRDCLGNAIKFRVASKDGRPIASIVTLRHKDTVTYKYGCSDVRYHKLGGMHLLLWRTIEESAREGLRILDLGRSDLDNTGLVTFKNRLGANCRSLTYLRSSFQAEAGKFHPWQFPVIRRLVSHLPDRVLNRAGKLLYRHVG